jgi:hypothetical protein
MTESLDISAMAEAVKARATALETEIELLRGEKKAIATVIKAKQEELDLAKSMIPRTRTRAPHKLADADEGPLTTHPVE